MGKEQREGTLFSIELHGYGHPAEWPRVLAEMFVLGHCSRAPEAIANFPFSLGGGYAMTFRHVPAPIRPMGRETLARVRRQRVERRIRAKAPMFAEQFIAEEMASKPGYYDGVTDAAVDAEREEALEAYAVRYAELMARPGVLVVYAQEPEACRVRAEALRAEMEAIRNRARMRRMSDE